MKKTLRKFQQDAFTVAGVGIGLSAVSSMDSTGSTGALSKGLVPISSMVVASAGIGMINNMNKSIKKLK